ncbi:hypothetical protein K3G63_04990 [Hymenobacter sp. HSC-4F20]|uniref:hypothetical protein n=1 Tax=Hymenobacter sp. HSC-4F20 TaxID=2864135 RepID=UPI001C72BD86|nr:hypothetical protein [Hymenobacter sp. HSC-4F20]MBX0289781.1 hypothetical protein [Hymenobacter sp. HSC-4F20]
MQTVPFLLRQVAGCLLLSGLLAGCGHSLPELPGFDSATWRTDSYGCQNRRTALLPVLEKHRDLLYGARVNDITRLLGHPDEEELGEQSDKVYIYYVASGLQCSTGHPRSGRARVLLRSGATGTITEVILPVLSSR